MEWNALAMAMLRLTLDNWGRARNKSFPDLRTVVYLLWAPAQTCMAAGRIIHKQSFGPRPHSGKSAEAPTQEPLTPVVADKNKRN